LHNTKACSNVMWGQPIFLELRSVDGQCEVLPKYKCRTSFVFG
jgi:hypothetical protein